MKLSLILVLLSWTFMHFYSNCSFIFDTYSINLCFGYQLFIICPLIPLYFSKTLHRYSNIYLPNVWTLPSESCLPFCLVQEYSYVCGQGGGRNSGGSGGILVSLWRSLRNIIRMRRPSKHGSKASKSGCCAITLLQQTASAIGTALWLVRLAI